jgi:hypothetical protein
VPGRIGKRRGSILDVAQQAPQQIDLTLTFHRKIPMLPLFDPSVD